LQHILTRSLSGAALAVKRVTENRGKKTAGIDKVTWNNPRQKTQAIVEIRRGQYQAKPLRRIYIPKSNGQLRPLGIPVMKCRAMQALHLLALDPIAECRADLNSYGFRRERSPADAMAQCFSVLAKRHSPEWVLEGDIKSCYDKISHQWLLEHIPMNKRILSQWLKSGYIDDKIFYDTEVGTPQGGIISPVLANMTLDGLETMLKTRFKNHKVNVIRFADDFIITGKSRGFLEMEIKPLLEAFLTQRGLTLSQEKTKITSTQEGFDFLGMHIRRYNKKLLIKPSKKSIKNLLSHIKEIVSNNISLKTSQLIEQLNPVLRGWANYNKHVVSSHIFSYIDNVVWQMLWRWCLRRHPGKTRKQWIKDKYFRTTDRKKWIFSAKTEKGKNLDLFKVSSTPIKRHIKIRGNTNPYDPQYETYLEQRLMQKWQRGDNGTGRLRHLWIRQQGQCPQCQSVITKQTGWHTHHCIRRTEGGKDTLDNLVLMHPTCHRQLHANDRRGTNRIL
jgi:RNA-directed DNA polymerase